MSARRLPSLLLVHGAATVAAGCGFALPEPFETDRGAYAEFVDFDELELELPTLVDTQTALFVGIRPGDVGSGALESLLLGARRHGVPVRAWLLLDDADGYWPGEGNLEAYDRHVQDFWRWNRGGELGVQWLQVDMEPPLPVSNELARAIEDGNLAAALPVLLANRDAEAFAASQRAWADAVAGWQHQGMKVAVVALPYVLDDLADGDTELQDLFDSPVADIAWDEVGFMVYQTLFGTPQARLGPALVASYGATAVEHFDDRAAVALGTIGSIGKNTASVGYDDREALQADLDAAAGVGVERLQLFGIDGMRTRGGVSMWLDGLAADGRAVEPSAAVDDARALVGLLD